MDNPTPTATVEVHQEEQTRDLSGSPIIESTIAASEATNTGEAAEPDIATHPTVPLAPLTKPSRYFQVNWWSVVALALLLILVGEHTAPFLLPLVDGYLHPTAIVTLFPTQKKMRQTYSFLVVTGTADQSRNQIPSRLLSFTSPTQSATITTTGTGYTPARKAHGTVTFYNEAPYNQTIDAGTIIAARDSIQIVTDQTVTIARGSGVTNGSAKASAHTIRKGVRANIPPFSINTLCCLSGILARNTTPFTGGQDPKPYPMLASADVQREVATLAASLEPTAQQGIRQQVKAAEQFLRPMHCQLTTTTNPHVGERATTASVSVFATCTAQVYEYSLLHSLTRDAFLTDAKRQAGSNFVQRGNPTIAIERTTVLDRSHNTYRLDVLAEGGMIFHLSATRLQRLKTQIAGEKVRDAQNRLLQLHGVQGVSIKPAHHSDLFLPTNPDQIQMIVSVLIPGEGELTG
jgi:hypothetical protein